MTATWRMGEITFHVLYDGTFEGDGGVFYGVVPKSLWQKKQKVGPDNTFPVPVRPLLAEVGGKRILVETGLGNKFESKGKFVTLWGIQQPVTLMQGLQGLGLQPEDIDIVILTHLHFDHCGWNTRRDEGGRIVPTFPRARYCVQRREYAEARYPGPLNRNSYFAENLVPVEEAGLWELLEGDTEIMPGVSTMLAPGHVPALQMVRFESQGQVAVAVSDLMPGVLNARPVWNTAYDLDPAANTQNKQRTLAQAAREGWSLFFYHDPEVLLAKVQAGGVLKPLPP